jgi:hypothetical protein
MQCHKPKVKRWKKQIEHVTYFILNVPQDAIKG